MKEDNILERILTNEAINRVFRKAEKLDHLIERTGKEPGMRKAVNKTILPFRIDRHLLWNIERCFDHILKAVEKKT